MNFGMVKILQVDRDCVVNIEKGDTGSMFFKNDVPISEYEYIFFVDNECDIYMKHLITKIDKFITKEGIHLVTRVYFKVI